MANQKILAQGAEAKIILSNNVIIKDRIQKSYRIPELDNKIRRQRTKSEAKLLEKASKIVNIPKITETKENKIVMDFIDGKKLSECLDDFPLKEQIGIMNQVGEDIAKLHNSNIIHGDLTTSNMILSEAKIFFIDFGLGFISHKLEDKAVDLRLLKQALEAKHYKNWQELWKAVEKGYLNVNVDSNQVLERLKAVESRGRYKEKY